MNTKMTVKAYLTVCWTPPQIFDTEINIYDNETKELITKERALFLESEIENAELVSADENNFYIVKGGK